MRAAAKRRAGVFGFVLELKRYRTSKERGIQGIGFKPGIEPRGRNADPHQGKLSYEEDR
jgi:hypothetical protein